MVFADDLRDKISGMAKLREEKRNRSARSFGPSQFVARPAAPIIAQGGFGGLGISGPVRFVSGVGSSPSPPVSSYFGTAFRGEFCFSSNSDT
jgi:hypothetical protein